MDKIRWKRGDSKQYREQVLMKAIEKVCQTNKIGQQ
jgi:hypothetical protein